MVPIIIGEWQLLRVFQGAEQAECHCENMLRIRPTYSFIQPPVFQIGHRHLMEACVLFLRAILTSGHTTSYNP